MQKHYYCVGYADDGEKATDDVLRLKPDIILVDYHLKETNGPSLLEKLRSLHPDAYFFMLTMRRDANLRNRSAEIGAKGYLLKTIGAEEMIRIFDLVCSGNTAFYDSLSKFKIDTSGNEIKRLTERELEIARLVCQEYSSEKIAMELNLSLHTINTHRKNILRKINAKNAIDLMNYLKSLGD